MGIFNNKRDNKSKINEETQIVNGYVIGVDTKIIYHIPDKILYHVPDMSKVQEGCPLFLPNEATSLSKTAIMEMRHLKINYLYVPGSFKKFNYELLSFENLAQIDFGEGVEEVRCHLGTRKNAVDIKLPTTIKKIGAGNYPIVQDLVLPNGVVEIDGLFASHDTYLVSVDIPGTLKAIPQGAFNQCKNLQRVVLNEGVETTAVDALRGTNNLRTLVLPSTYNGTLGLSMDPRPGSNIRGNSRYDGQRFEEEQNAILNIKIRRGNKDFEFNIRRGDQPTIGIQQNIIKIKCAKEQQIISIDCEQLEPGIYTIQNGTIKNTQSEFFQEQPEKKDDTTSQERESASKVSVDQQESDDLAKVIKELEEKKLECYMESNYEQAAVYQRQIAIISLIQAVDINGRKEFIEKNLTELEMKNDYETRAYWLSACATIESEKQKNI